MCPITFVKDKYHCINLNKKHLLSKINIRVKNELVKEK